MFLVQKSARRDAVMSFVDCPRHGLHRAYKGTRCYTRGCTYRLPYPWRRPRGFDVASWKPVCYGAYRAHVRDQLRGVVTGALDADDADFYPQQQHLLTAFDVA